MAARNDSSKRGTRSPRWGPAVDAAIPVLLTLLVLLASAWQSLLVPLAAVAAVTGAARAGVRRGAFAALLSAAGGAGAVIASVTVLREVLVAAAVTVVVGVFPWTLGLVWRARRDAREAAAALAVQREQAREREAEARRAGERMLLAEELHDDLGHVLSLVALNLGRLELDPALEEAPRQAIGRARTQVAEAVGRLGGSVEALRGDQPPALLSRHQRADLDRLLADVRAAGAAIEVTGRPPPERLAAFDAPTVFRVVQEGITNAVKHAPGQPVAVRFTDAGDRLEVAVANPRPAVAEARTAATGSGLVALRERARLAGGGLHVDADPAEFTLTVRLPLAGGALPARRGGTGTAGGSGTAVGVPAAAAAGLRRRAWLVALVPLLLVGLAGAITLVDVAEARRAELGAEAFAQITPGQSRAEAESLLPADALSGSEDEPGCRHFAITSDPLDDAFGDFYRICFADDAVASAERVEGGGL
jgi:signal transduction histidine kinase